jgi:hypothetical protein
MTVRFHLETGIKRKCFNHSAIETVKPAKNRISPRFDAGDGPTTGVLTQQSGEDAGAPGSVIVPRATCHRIAPTTENFATDVSNLCGL